MAKTVPRKDTENVRRKRAEAKLAVTKKAAKVGIGFPLASLSTPVNFSPSVNHTYEVQLCPTT